METAEPRCVSMGSVGTGGCDGAAFFSHFVCALRAGGYGKGSGTCKFNIGLSEQAVVSFRQAVLWDQEVDFTAEVMLEGNHEQRGSNRAQGKRRTRLSCSQQDRPTTELFNFSLRDCWRMHNLL